MAKIERIKKSNRGKDLKCSKCGREIAVGDEYLKATPYKRPPIIRCTSCGLKHYEISGSEYIRTIGAIVESWQDDYGVHEGVHDEIISAIEEARDMCQDSLDNMPEQLQEGDIGQMLQDRIDQCEAAISDLESVDWDDCHSEAEEEAENEFGEYDPEDGTYENEEEFNGALSERVDELTEEKYADVIDEALQNLEY